MAYVDPLFYPADLAGLPTPDIAMGCFRMTSKYNAHLLIMHPDNPAIPALIGYTGANEIINAAQIDANLTAGSVLRGRAPSVINQMNPGVYDAQGTNTAAAVIGKAEWNGIRSMYFEGGSDFNGIMDWMSINILPLVFRQYCFSAVMIMKPTTSLARNVRVNGTATINTIFEFANLASVASATFNSDGRSVPGFSSVIQSASFGPTLDMPPEVSPSTIMLIRNKNFIRIRQNGRMRKVTGLPLASTLDPPPSNLWIARKVLSVDNPVVPPFLPMNEAGDYWWWGLLLYNNVALDEGQCATLDRSINLRMGKGIGQVSRSQKSITVCGDSIAAEFTTDALNGWLTRTNALMPYPVQVFNMAVAGTTVTDNNGVAVASVLGIFPTYILPKARISPRGNQLIYWGGGNDAQLSPQPTAVTVANQIIAHCAAWVAAGGTKPIVMTILKRADAFNAYYAAINALLIAGAGANYEVADVASIAQFDGTVNPYIPDGTHPGSPLGGDLIANFLQPYIIGASHLGPTA